MGGAMKTLDPKKTLAALRAGEEVVPHTSEQLAQARRWSENPASAPSAEVESLPEPLALAVLEAAVQSGASPLAEALASSKQKALAKAARKAIYQLRSRGVEVAEPAREESAPRAEVAAAPEELPSLLSTVTGTGERAMMVVRPLRGGGLETFQVVFTDEAGILQLDRGELSRGDYRRQLRALRQGTASLLEVSLERARELLSIAGALNLATRTPFPKGSEDALRHLDAPPVGVAPPLPHPEEGDERRAVQGHTLHQEPELASWLPPEEQLRVLSGHLDEQLHSVIELSEVQRNEQVRLRFIAAAVAFFTAPMKQLYAQRLWQIAELFENTHRPEPAAIARAEARRLFHGAPGSSRFGEFLFEKVLLLTQRSRAGQPLPAPGERLEPVAPKERTRPGGLILP